MRLILSMVLLSAISTKLFASCGIPKLIPEDEQFDLRQKVIFTVIDKDFLDKKGTDIVTIEIPDKYKDKFLHKAFITYWEDDKVMTHSNLRLSKGYSFPELSDEKERDKSGSKIIEFSLNQNSTWLPKITLVYGDKCYSRYQLNVDHLFDFNKLIDDKYEWSREKQNRIFTQGR